MHGHERERPVGAVGQREARTRRIGIEEHAQHQEQQDHDGLAAGREHDVLLCVARRGAAQVLLHHVLVEARHGHQHEDAGEEHLPEVAPRGGIVEKEDARQGRADHVLRRLGPREPEGPHDEKERQHEAAHQTGRLERVGPDERLHAPAPRIEPHEQHREGRIAPQRHAPGIEDQLLHHGAHHEDLERGPEHLRDEKEPGPRMVGRRAEARIEVLVERHHVQAVEERNQHESHRALPHGEAEHHLHVGERIVGHRAWHRYERDARHGAADHGESRHVPGRAAVAREETGIVGAAPRKPGHEKEDCDVGRHGGDNCSGCHARK